MSDNQPAAVGAMEAWLLQQYQDNDGLIRVDRNTAIVQAREVDAALRTAEEGRLAAAAQLCAAQEALRGLLSFVTETWMPAKAAHSQEQRGGSHDGWIACSETETGHRVGDCPQDLDEDDEVYGRPFGEIREAVQSAAAALADAPGCPHAAEAAALGTALGALDNLKDYPGDEAAMRAYVRDVCVRLAAVLEPPSREGE